jgi:queuosine precursor transporter
MKFKETIASQNAKFLIYFVMIYITFDLASNVVAYREVNIGSALFPGATFIYPLTYTIADIITEIYGYDIMRKVIWAGIICDFAFSLAVIGVLHLPHPLSWHHEPAYDVVLGNLLRLNIACAVALLIGAFANIYIICKWKILVQGKYFWLRSLGSSAIGELIYLGLAAVISFYGIVTTHVLMRIIVSDYSFKMLYTCIAVIPASILVALLKKYENVSPPVDVDFNPFKLI